VSYKEKHTEKGQALVLVVFALVGLFGFVALALDGGMVYADRRYAQNASDASSLAGAAAAAVSIENSSMTSEQWNCGDTRMYNAIQAGEDTAINRAVDNDFVIDKVLDDNNGVDATCGQHHNGAWEEQYIDITTLISSTTQTSFVHLVFSGPLINNVESVARVRPRTALAHGEAIVALNDANCVDNQHGLVFSGNNNIQINGGGTFSNGCMTGNGTSFTLHVTNGTNSYAGLGQLQGTTFNIHPPAQYFGSKLDPDSYAIDPPDCSGLTNYGSATTGGTIFPGIYDRIRLNNGVLTMEPGLYCITGSPSGFTINGGTVTGDGVTIYLINGGGSISGNAIAQLDAPEITPDPSPAVPGLLFYLGPGNTNLLSLTGNDESWFVGTVYAPDGDIKVAGTNGTHPTFNTQLIGWNVEVEGTANIDINFNGDDNHTKPTKIDLYK
jgi:Flp pilus assembly protein TadG